ncbi:MAG: sodium-translocating pyrophosphatase [archaeon]
MVEPLLYGVVAVSLIAVLFALYTYGKIKKEKKGDKKTQEISDLIAKGARTFLRKEYQVISVFVVIVTVLLAFINWRIAVSFIIGSIFSALAGNLGMRVATSANARTANAVKRDLKSGLKVAYSSGIVMAMSVVGFGLFGVSVLYIIFQDPEIIYGFGFGASAIALFARVGGGIYTKAADTGADIVGKVEAGIPEDDPRNPATIADNVGDNVGDVAGMGADLFESYVESIIAAMVLGAIIVPEVGGISLTFPLIIAAVGILASIIGTFFLGGVKNVYSALNKPIYAAAILMAIAVFAISYYIGHLEYFYVVVIGMVAGIVIGWSTEYYTSAKLKPTRSIALASQTGAASNVTQGLAIGMLSSIIPVVIVCLAIYFAYFFAGLYGVSIAAVGMLSLLGVTLAADTYGPVADNAAGIAEMAGLGKKVRERAEALDEVGNTTAAIGKGFAIGSAALTALALFASYSQVAEIESINLLNTSVMVALFIGALLPFVFSAFTMKAVRKAASGIIDEVRSQFKDKAIRSGKKKPNYDRVIAITTHASLREMILPVAIAILAPIVIYYLLGAEAVGGLLAGTIASGFLLALFMANAGGALDNAKKYIEAGNLGGKGSEAHKAAVVGDTVGDPLKDTSGPALNILIKLISVVALLLALLLQ